MLVEAGGLRVAECEQRLVARDQAAPRAEGRLQLGEHVRVRVMVRVRGRGRGRGRVRVRVRVTVRVRACSLARSTGQRYGGAAKSSLRWPVPFMRHAR